MRIGRYELLLELARGGMATLHLARRLGPDQFQRLVAIKRVHEQLSDDPEAMGRFLDEARLAARIVHPNVVQIFDFDRQDGSQYIAMEYVHGVDLMALFNRAAQTEHSGYHWSHMARVVAEAAAGLHAAHELVGDNGRPLGLVHRDVSPQNILLSFDGHVKVTDFGIAHAVGKAHMTMVGVVIGKVAYMSPEQCRGLPLDRRSDVFALGVVLHEMVTLRRLFRGETDQETMMRVVKGHIPPLASLVPDAPEALGAVVSRALAVDPDDRFQTAAQMQNALEQLLVSEGLLVNAGSLQNLLGGLFARERQCRDAQLAQLYRKTIQPGSGVRASGHREDPIRPIRVAEPGGSGDPEPHDPNGDRSLTIGEEGEADLWDEAAAPTIQDTAPPAVMRSSGAFRTRLGFGGADSNGSLEPVMPNGRVTPEARIEPGLSSQGSNDVPPRHGTAMGRPAMPDPLREAAPLGPGQGVDGPVPSGSQSKPTNSVLPSGSQSMSTNSVLPSGSQSMSTKSVVPSGSQSMSTKSILPSGSQSMSTKSLVASFQRTRWPWLAALAALALGAVVLVLWLVRRADEEAPGSRSPAGASARPGSSQVRLPPPPMSPEETVTIRVRVAPPGAHLWVGEEEWVGKEDADGTRAIRLPRKSQPIVLRVEANGHEKEERLVVPGEVAPGKGDELEVALKPARASTPRRWRSARPARAPARRSLRRTR